MKCRLIFCFRTRAADPFPADDKSYEHLVYCIEVSLIEPFLDPPSNKRLVLFQVDDSDTLGRLCAPHRPSATETQEESGSESKKSNVSPSQPTAAALSPSRLWQLQDRRDDSTGLRYTIRPLVSRERRG